MRCHSFCKKIECFGRGKVSRNRVFLQKTVIKNFDISRTSAAVEAPFRRASLGKINGWRIFYTANDWAWDVRALVFLSDEVFHQQTAGQINGSDPKAEEILMALAARGRTALLGLNDLSFLSRQQLVLMGPKSPCLVQ